MGNFLEETFLGTGGSAADKNEALLQEIRQLFESLRKRVGPLYGQAEQRYQEGVGDLKAGYTGALADIDQARTVAGGIGDASRQRASDAFSQALGGTNLASIGQGMYGSSSMLGNRAGDAERYIRSLRDIDESVAGIQTGLLTQRAGLQAEQGGALMQAGQGFSQFPLLKLGALQDIKGGKANMLSGFQYQGQPGLLHYLAQGAGQAVGGGLI